MLSILLLMLSSAISLLKLSFVSFHKAYIIPWLTKYTISELMEIIPFKLFPKHKDLLSYLIQVKILTKTKNIFKSKYEVAKEFLMIKLMVFIKNH
jgi:hypothetical protein